MKTHTHTYTHKNKMKVNLQERLSCMKRFDKDREKNKAIYCCT